MATLTSYTAGIGVGAGSGNREDLLDFVTIISPWETPFTTSLPKVDALAVTHEWLTDSLAATSTGGAVEGADFSADSPTGRTRHNNITMIFRQDFKVSNTQRANRPAGIDDEYKWQAMKRVRQIARNIEKTILHSATGQSNIGTASTARAMRILADFVTTNYFALREDEFDGTITAASDISATGVTETGFNTMLQKIWEQGGTTDSVQTNISGKRMISGFAGPSGTARNINLEDAKMAAVTDLYLTVVGPIEVTLNRWVSQATGNTATDHQNDLTGTIWFLERGMVQLAVYRPLEHVPLPPNGDATRGYVVGELTLEVLSEAALGRLVGVSELPSNLPSGV